MIITCPSCEKKFEVDKNLIPVKGRLLNCSSCNHTWFFNLNDQVKIRLEDIASPIKKNQENREKLTKKASKKKDEILNENISKINKNKGSEIIEYKSSTRFTFSNFLSYILVIIISFIALLIIIDTFKSPLYSVFPNLEFLLFSLYETLKDIKLFVKDLLI
tara:strand:+ start:1208 stop:1690 length:483 start_codon:yes stop_codon:yes gene_type:complete